MKIFLLPIAGLFALSLISLVFADHMQVDVSIPSGSSSPGCEVNNECFFPSEVTIDVGGEVTWTNNDSAGHTVTSGNNMSPDGVFDSSLFMAGKTFSYKFEEAGEFPYFCVVHPWMIGTIIVGGENGSTQNALFIKTDKSSYSVGDLVTFTGNGFSPSTTINVSIISSSGSIIQELSLFSTSVGSFQTVWVVPQQVVSDSYTIRATDNTKSSSITISITGIQTTNTVTVEMAKGSASNTDCGNFCFIPNTVTVPVGSTVAWKNVDSAAHTATDVNGLFDSSLVSASKSFKYKFDSDGTFEYLCIVHPWMKGTVIVGEGSYGETPQLSVETELPLYDQGDTVTVSGYIQNYNANNLSLVTLRIAGPLVNGESSSIVAIKQVQPQTNGSFKDAFVLSGPLWQKAGDYKIIVNYGTLRSETVFYYNGGGGSETLTGTAYVKTDSFYYERGDTVRIYGEVDSYLENTPLILQIFRDDNRVHIAQVEVAKNGSYIYTFSTDSHYFQTDGEYIVQVSYGVTGDIYETSFELESDIIDQPPVVETPIGDLPLNEYVNIPAGSSSPGCETNNQCFLSYQTVVARFGEVRWTNNDSAAHTVTSGSLESGPDGVFDSSLIMAGKTFTHRFEEEGRFPYFCVVHPWMTGMVIVGEGEPVPPPPNQITFDVKTDSYVYDIGNTVKITVMLTGTPNSQNIAISVTDPSGSGILSRTLQTQNGYAELDFRIPEDYKTGTYIVDATTSVSGINYHDSTQFKIKSQFNEVRIVSIESTDQQGNPRPFTKGEMGFVKVVVSSDKNITGLITVNVFDSELTTIGIGSIKTTLNPGQSEFILSFVIPQEIAQGNADIYANLFSDWPSNGGIPLTGEVSTQVSVN